MTKALSKNEKTAKTKIESSRALREGEKRLMSNGLTAEIVAYRKWDDIDILFEDGVLATGKHYSCFKKGSITHPKYSRELVSKTKISNAANERLGQSNKSTCGLTMEIIEYRAATDIDVLFENGERRNHVSWTHFKAGNVLPPSLANKKEARVGEKGLARDGSEMTIVEYRSSTDVDVQFADGSIQKGLPYSRFVKGEISVPKDNPKHKWKKYIGTTVRATCGLDMTFIGGERSQDITIQFEDGTIVTHKTLRFFLKGTIRHPILGAPGKSRDAFFGFTDLQKVLRLDDGRTFYYATSPDKERVVVTPQQMMSAGKKI